MESADLRQVKLARSPLQETLGSLAALTDRARHPVHRRWLRDLPRALGPLDLKLLPALTSRMALPDFLLPAPRQRDEELHTELEQVRAVDPGTVRSDLDEVFAGQPLPAVLAGLYEDPETQLAAIVEELVLYFDAVVEPIWPRLAALLEADLNHRARQLSDGGLTALFAELHYRVGYREDRLELDFPAYNCVHRLGGSGLTLVPSAFVWPRLMMVPPEVHSPMISFSALGVERLWERSDLPLDRNTDRMSDLGELLGKSRARMLVLLETPMTTTQLAHRLGISAPGVSLQLSILRRTQLVVPRRAGRQVFYERTHLGTTLLETVTGRAAAS